jgi:hypothetical protein
MFDFEVGQQVVCVYEGPWKDYDSQKPSIYRVPVKGAVYTVRQAHVLMGVLALELEELATGRSYDARRAEAVQDAPFRYVKVPIVR